MSLMKCLKNWWTDSHLTFTINQTKLTMRPYKIARLDDTGNWKVLASFTTYAKADLALEKYSEKYPNAWVDILDGALTLTA